MGRLLMLGAIGVLVVAFAPRSSAAIHYNSSKSNTGNFVLSYNPDMVTQAQAGAVLADLEKPGHPADEYGVRDVLEKQGVQNDHIRKIIIEPGPGGKGTTILLLVEPGDEKAARDAASGLATGKRQR